MTPEEIAALAKSLGGTTQQPTETGGRGGGAGSMTPDRIAALAQELGAIDPAELQKAKQEPGHPLRAIVDFLGSLLPGTGPTADTIADQANFLPAVGGALGGIAGGVPGAAFGGVAGESARQHVRRALGASAPSTPGEAVKDMAVQGAINAGAEGGGRLVASIGERTAKAMMQSAVQPGIKSTVKALVKGTDLPVVNTMLKEGINVTPTGVQRLAAIIEGNDAHLTELLEGLPATIRPEEIAKGATEAAQRALRQAVPQSDVAAIEATGQKFLSHPLVTEERQIGTNIVDSGIYDASGKMVTREVPIMGQAPKSITPSLTQELKQGTYERLGTKNYGELKSAEIEGEKALASKMREQITRAAMKEAAAIRASNPARAKELMSVDAINARTGRAIEAMEAVAKRVARAGNGDHAAFAWLAHNPQAGLAFALYKSPAIKSMLARGLYASAAKASGVAENVLRLLVSSIVAGTNDDTPPQPAAIPARAQGAGAIR